MENTTDREIEALIVEDEIDICFLLTGILRKKNLETAFVNTLQDAQNTLKSKNPGILIIDNNLPDGLGIDFIYQIKHTNPSIKIIMITANDTVSDKEKAFKAGADFFLGKPFTRDALNKTLDLVMERVH